MRLRKLGKKLDAKPATRGAMGKRVGSANAGDRGRSHNSGKKLKVQNANLSGTVSALGGSRASLE